MKKTFPALVLALACIVGIAVLIDASASKTPVVVSSASKPIPARPAFAQTATKATRVPDADSRTRLAAIVLSTTAVIEPSSNAAKDGAQFVAKASGMNVALTTRGILVRIKPTNNGSTTPDTLGIQVKGAGPHQWHGTDKAQGETNYFFVNDPRKWRTYIARFNRVETADADGLSLAV